MKRRWLTCGWMALLSAVVLPATLALAAGPEEGDDDGKGTVYVRISDAFAQPYANGELWEEHAFERAGKTLVLEGLMRDQTYSFEIRPQNGRLAAAILEIGPKCWKLKRLSRTVREWRCEPRQVRFKKARAVPEPAPEPETRPAPPEEDLDIPPMPGVPPPPPPDDGSED